MTPERDSLWTFADLRWAKELGIILNIYGDEVDRNV